MESDNLESNMSYLNITGLKRASSCAFQQDYIDQVSPEPNSEETDENNHLRRSHRKRIKPLEAENRRVLTKPKKLEINANSKDTVNYYLDKRIKRLPPTLETIFEEPKSDSLMSTRKFKRCINFSDDGLCKDKLKVKKRSMKAKKVSSIKRLRKKVSMELLMKKLSNIEESEQETNNVLQ